MLVWDVAFASRFASKLQVTGRSKQSCPHFQENLCRNTLYRPRREQAKQGFSRTWCHLAGLSPGPHRAPAAAQAPDPASFPMAFPHKSPLPPCIPQLLPCSRLSLLSQVLLSAPLELHPYCSSSPSFSLWLERPGGMLTWDTLLHHSSGKGPFSLWWRRDTPNDLCYQSPQVPFTSLSSRLTAKFTFPKPLSSFYRFFDSLRVFLCYSGAIQLMASQHCHYKPELFRCLLLSFKNWLYAEIWQTKCQPRRKFYFLPILYSKKKWPHFGLHKNAAFAASMTLVK